MREATAWFCLVLLTSPPLTRGRSYAPPHTGACPKLPPRSPPPPPPMLPLRRALRSLSSSPLPAPPLACCTVELISDTA